MSQEFPKKEMNKPEESEAAKYKEPPYVRENLEKGEFGVGYFFGQTLLFIPKSVVEAVGMEKIKALADQVFGKEVLDAFAGSSSENYELSCMLELPPQATNEYPPKINKENNQVTALIKAIRESAGV